MPWSACFAATENVVLIDGHSNFVFLAAIVRGYSGFGFSLLAITALSLL